MGLTVDQREGAAVLPALELALLAEHLSLGQRDVLVAAAVVDGVDVVVDAHHRYGDAVDGDLSDSARRYVVEPADALGAHDIAPWRLASTARSEEHTSELQSLMRISYAVFCLKKKNTITSS